MSTQQPAPATQKLKEQICISDTNQSAACAVGSVPAGPKRKDMLWSTAKMQERHDQRIENIVSGLERIKQEHAGQKPQKIDECYGDCPTDPTTCTNPCRFDGRAARAPADSVTAPAGPSKPLPYEPTSAMLIAARERDPALPIETVRAIYWSMWRTAPTPPAQAADSVLVEG